MFIGNKKIGNSQPTFIVAEMSANHGGNIENAKKLIKDAKEVGADAIKLQTYTPDTITFKSNKKDFRIDESSPWYKEKTLWNLYKEAHTPFDWHQELFSFAKNIGIDIFSTPFDETAVDLLEDLNCICYKIASPEIINIPLLEKVAYTKKPVIISTGVCNLEELDTAVKTITKYNDNLIILKCTTSYPAPPEEMNLHTITAYKEKYKCLSGISDHSKGYLASVISTSLGGTLIEKHFKSNLSIPTHDSFFSLNKNEFREMVENVRLTERCLGRTDFDVSASSKSSINSRSSIYVVKPLYQGNDITSKEIKVIRPGYSLHPKFYNQIIGKKVNKDLMPGDRISLDDIE